MLRFLFFLLLRLSLLSLLHPSVAAAVSPLVPHSIRIEHQYVSSHPDLVLQTHTPHFDWQLAAELASDATSPLRRSLSQTAYRLRILRADNVHFDSGRVQSAQSVQLGYSGPHFTSDTSYRWQLMYWSSTGAVSDWAEGTFRTALFDTATDWHADWIGSDRINMNQLRRTFTLPSDAARATVFYSGVGYSELWLDGAKVDPSRVLDPGWTNYYKRCLYVSFDLTARLQKGDHAIGILLGDGWYSRQPGLWNTLPSNVTYGPPRLLLQLNVQLADGSNWTLVSDEQWQGKQSHIVAAGVYQGQIIDKRLERNDWSTAHFNDNKSLWLPVDVLPSPLSWGGQLSLQMMDPIRKGEPALHIHTTQTGGGQRLRAARIGVDIRQRVLRPTTESQWGYGALFDLNQNMVGWCTINTTLPRGSSVYVRYAEYRQAPRTNPYADTFTNLDASNYFNIAAEDTYIVNGSVDGMVGAVEVLEPSMTYRGFRYVNVYTNTGLPASSVSCPVVHSEGTLVGNFSTDNDIINQIQQNILWSQIGNTMSLMTDCPQRNERRGWLGDAAGSADLSMFMFDFANVYRNILLLIRDEQNPTDGSLPVMAPYSSACCGLIGSDPSWSTAYTTIAWYLYDHYGDTAILAQHYDGIEAYFLGVYNGWYKQHGLKGMPGLFFDWFYQLDGPTAGPLVSSYSVMKDLYHLVQISAVLGKQDKTTLYNKTYLALAAEFHDTWYNATTGGYDTSSQTANALALALPYVVPDSLRAAVAKNVADDITSKGHLTAGIIGVSQLFLQLSATGHHNVAVALASSTQYPSWGWTFTNQYENATTIWENFDAGMNPDFASHNHHMFSPIASWFYRCLAGIQLNGLHGAVRVHPRLQHDHALLSSVYGEVQTVKGMVSSAWESEWSQRRLQFNVTVPINAQAMVVVECPSKGGR